MIKLKKIINESLQLPNGTKIEMGRIFTGQGKAFVKEEDLNEKKKYSDDWNLTKRVTSNFIKQNLKSVDNSIKKKDGEGLRFHLNQIIKGIQNAKRALKLESVNERKVKMTKHGTIHVSEVPSYQKAHYPTQKHWDYYQSLPKGKKHMYYKKYPEVLAKASKQTDDFIAQQKKKLGLESVNEATSLGADMIIGGIVTVIKKAGMRPKSAKMMGGGFKVSKRDKVGFKIDVEIRGMDKKKTFPLQFEIERGMLYVVIKNKPIKLGKYTMATQTAQNLKKVGTALMGDKNIKRIA